MLLLAIALLGLVSATTLSVGATIARRDAERELLAIGAEFERALRSYAGAAAMAGPAAVMPGIGGGADSAGAWPRNLEDLLKDPRTPGVRRHLRQVYADPLTGKAEWGTVTGPGGGIVGVYSLAPGRPIRQEGFEPAWGHFTGAAEYRQWVFGKVPVGATPKTTTPRP